jgi:hypothetical protein
MTKIDQDYQGNAGQSCTERTPNNSDYLTCGKTAEKASLEAGGSICHGVPFPIQGGSLEQYEGLSLTLSGDPVRIREPFVCWNSVGTLRRENLLARQTLFREGEFRSCLKFM